MEDEADILFLDVSDLGFNLEQAGGVAEGELSGTADADGTVEGGANAGIAHILAGPMEDIALHIKVDLKARRDAARPIFEFADGVRGCHRCRNLGVLENGRASDV